VKCILLAGGLGTRMREETDFRPKPMVMIGNRPILWHIMRNFAHFELKDFVICSGYKGEVIRSYFTNFRSEVSDFTLELGRPEEILFHSEFIEKDWKVTVAETGQDTMTGGRLFKARKYIDEETFICTYGDGLANVDVRKLLDFHKSHGKIATVTAVRPISRFGVLDIEEDNLVSRFREKPQADGWINVGFFVFSRKIFDYLNVDSVLEKEPLSYLASQGQLAAYKHEGFWQPLDTFREYSIFNELWNSGDAPWKVW
jgi:glucose-1-phosphate cytidylyltransferase